MQILLPAASRDSQTCGRATDDPDLEQPKTRLLGRGPTEEQQAQLEERLQKWSRVLCDSTGKTNVLCHINTGGSPPIRSPMT